MAMLDVKNISKSFGSTHVLKDISFSLEQESLLLSSVSPEAARPLCSAA